MVVGAEYRDEAVAGDVQVSDEVVGPPEVHVPEGDGDEEAGDDRSTPVPVAVCGDHTDRCQDAPDESEWRPLGQVGREFGPGDPECEFGRVLDAVAEYLSSAEAEAVEGSERFVGEEERVAGEAPVVRERECDSGQAERGGQRASSEAQWVA